MAQKTAVEWLFDKLDVIIELDSTKWDKIAESVAKAKEMEKQEKEICWIAALEYGLKVLKTDENANSKEAFEQYYTQTYGK
jgi:hypothetical protein